MTQNAETIVTIITKFDVKYKNFFGQNIQWKKNQFFKVIMAVEIL